VFSVEGPAEVEIQSLLSQSNCFLSDLQYDLKPIMQLCIEVALFTGVQGLEMHYLIKFTQKYVICVNSVKYLVISTNAKHL